MRERVIVINSIYSCTATEQAKHDVPNLSEPHRPWLHLIRASTRTLSNGESSKEREQSLGYREHRDACWRVAHGAYSLTLPLSTPVDNKAKIIRLTPSIGEYKV